MRSDGINNNLGFATTLDELRADNGVRSLDFVVDGFADVVEQAGSFGGGDFQTEFRGHQRHDLGDFNGVI